MICRLAVLLVLLAPIGATAQPIEIKSARIGLPSGRFSGDATSSGQSSYIAKNNAWAPVYVTFEIVREVKREAAIVIETTDSDDLKTYTSVPLQNLTAEQPGTRIQPTELRFIPYVRPNSRGDVRVTICVPEKGTSPDRWLSLSAPFLIREVAARDTAKYVVLSLGSNLPGFILPKEAEANPDTQSMRTLRNGRIETASITNVAEMPDQWFGYDAADLVVLCTGTDDRFVTELFTLESNKPRLNALLEWIRRGGRLVVSVGRNATLLSQADFEPLRAILPVKIKTEDPLAQVTRLSIVWSLPKITESLGVPLAAENEVPFPMANVEIRKDRAVRMLVPPEGRRNDEERPTVMLGAYGLGKITLVTFDLDRSPFVDYSQRSKFWNNLLNESGSYKAANGSATSAASNSGGYGYGFGTANEGEDELASTLRSSIDSFEGVPVISFGWVAVFILLYTLLIGPVEYFILKKVFGRLELTWLTFPIIVITVSAIAYFTAYAIKGKDLKINKVDLIDIDPASERIYGRTWVTLFSPRIDNYRIGIDPNPGWAANRNDSPTAGSLVDWFGGARTGSKSFLRRNYFYHIDPPGSVTHGAYDNGLMDVPITVWSTKAFSADWSATLDREKPLVASDLNHPASNPQGVAGTFTLNLPFKEIKDAYIIYAGKGYKQNNPIFSGTAYHVVLKDEDIDANWLSHFGAQTSLSVTQKVEDTSRTRSFQPPTSTSRTSTGSSIAEILFHDEKNAGNDTAAPRNSTLRRLDQSWRLSIRNREEIIVVARLPSVKGPTEEVLTGPGSISPTRLWLRELPGEGKSRTAILGNLKQDTYVRIFVPINR